MARHITDLNQLDEAWFGKAIARVVEAAPILVRPPFNPDVMAYAIYALPVLVRPPLEPELTGPELEPDTRQKFLPCRRGQCPVDETGTHQREAMVKRMVATHFGARATKPVVDGLAPADIVHIKGHAAATAGMSNWETHARGLTMAGDPSSTGAVYAQVHLGDSQALRFVVAVSGTKRWKDHQLARTLAEAVIADLVEEDRIADPCPPSPTFIYGLDPSLAAAYALARSRATAAQ